MHRNSHHLTLIRFKISRQNRTYILRSDDVPGYFLAASSLLKLARDASKCVTALAKANLDQDIAITVGAFKDALAGLRRSLDGNGVVFTLACHPLSLASQNEAVAWRQRLSVVHPADCAPEPV